jgi:hypothetical protein
MFSLLGVQVWNGINEQHDGESADQEFVLDTYPVTNGRATGLLGIQKVSYNFSRPLYVPNS